MSMTIYQRLLHSRVAREKALRFAQEGAGGYASSVAMTFGRVVAGAFAPR
jgi:hypothetical protein